MADIKRNIASTRKRLSQLAKNAKNSERHKFFVDLEILQSRIETDFCEISGSLECGYHTPKRPTRNELELIHTGQAKKNPVTMKNDENVMEIEEAASSKISQELNEMEIWK